MIELKGMLKNISAFDSNLFILLTDSGKHVGDLTIVDDHMLEKINSAMDKRKKETGDKAVTSAIVLPITLTIKTR